MSWGSEILAHLGVAERHIEVTRSDYEKAKLSATVALTKAIMLLIAGNSKGALSNLGHDLGATATGLLHDAATPDEPAKKGEGAGATGVPIAAALAGRQPATAREADLMNPAGINGRPSPMEPQEQTDPKEQNKVYKAQDKQLYKDTPKPQPSEVLAAYQPPPPVNPRTSVAGASDRNVNPDEANSARPQPVDATSAHAKGTPPSEVSVPPADNGGLLGDDLSNAPGAKDSQKGQQEPIQANDSDTALSVKDVDRPEPKKSPDTEVFHQDPRDQTKPNPLETPSNPSGTTAIDKEAGLLGG